MLYGSVTARVLYLSGHALLVGISEGTHGSLLSLVARESLLWHM